MWILNQTKEGLINLDNFKEVNIKFVETNKNEKEYSYCIYADSYCLGVYTSRIRCTVIIRDIMDKLGWNSGDGTYYMPEK